MNVQDKASTRSYRRFQKLDMIALEVWCTPKYLQWFLTAEEVGVCS